MVASIIIVKSTLVCEHDLWMQWLYICMLCLHEAIKGPAKLVIIVDPDEILSPSLYVWCDRDQKYITIESFSNLKSTKWSSKQIVVQGDSDHDLCIGGLYAEATVVLTSTQMSRPSNRQWTHTTDSRVKV
jgi:hypothetical protein